MVRDYFLLKLEDGSAASDEARKEVDATETDSEVAKAVDCTVNFVGKRWGLKVCSHLMWLAPATDFESDVPFSPCRRHCCAMLVVVLS